MCDCRFGDLFGLILIRITPIKPIPAKERLGIWYSKLP
jgi:hypothetical protein